MQKVSNEKNETTLNLHVSDIKKYTEESIITALEMIGLKAESYAKAKCPVDTGLLRNSIAHALAGEQPSIGTNFKNTTKKARTYKANKPDKKGNLNRGTYSRQAPKKKGEYRVYIGTNVHYAPEVEMGHVTKSGRKTRAQPFIRPALMGHVEEWKAILATCLKEIEEEQEQENDN